MKGKTKKSIIVLIVLLAVGFAAVTTTLTINGTIRLGANRENFEQNLVFTKAELSYTGTMSDTEEDSAEITNNGKGISFTTKTLKSIGDIATLTYDITNNSQYSAEFTGITCTVKNASDVDVTDAVKAGTEYITLDAQDFTELKEGATEKSNIKLAKGGVLAGRTLAVTLRKSYVGTETTTSTSYTVECTINASGLSD